MKLFGENITVNAKIEVLNGISGHADMNGLIRWLEGFETELERVIVVHGEDTVTDSFASLVEDKIGCPGLCALFRRLCGSGGKPDYKRRCKDAEKGCGEAGQKPGSGGFRTGWWPLPNVCLKWYTKNEGLANKELAKFESQIQNLADKWDR